MKKAKEQHAGSGHYCGECCNGHWLRNVENLDCMGNPFVVECPNADWVINNGHHYTLRGNAACPKFMKGTRKV